MPRPCKPKGPFRYFNFSPEVIRLLVANACFLPDVTLPRSGIVNVGVSGQGIF